MKNKLTISNILILISLIFTIIVYFYPNFYIFWINKYFFYKWDYLIYFFQFFSWTFIHSWITHLLMNSIFLYYFWNQLEFFIWKKKYLIFFLTTTIFLWLIISNTSTWNTVWISWFAMALLSYYTALLFSLKNPEYKWWITAILINVWIGLIPWISLSWHLFWAIYWVLFFYITKKSKK